MPPRKRRAPTKEEIIAAADRAEGKKPRSKKKSGPDPIDASLPVPEELEELPGGVKMVIRRPAGGRPPKYKPEYAKIAKAMIKRGALISELASLFGVANSTIHLWQQTYPEFMEAFIEINESYDARIERCLAERALGYTFDAVKYFHFQGNVVAQPYREHVPPDITAIKLWLGQRKPEQWRVRDEVEVNANEAFVEIWKRLGEKREG